MKHKNNRNKNLHSSTISHIKKINTIIQIKLPPYFAIECYLSHELHLQTNTLLLINYSIQTVI